MHGIAGYVIKELHENKVNNTAMKSGMLALTRSQLISKCETYLKKGELPEYARFCLDDLYRNYESLGGNHGMKLLVDKCFDLPLRKEENKDEQ